MMMIKNICDFVQKQIEIFIQYFDTHILLRSVASWTYLFHVLTTGAFFKILPVTSNSLHFHFRQMHEKESKQKNSFGQQVYDLKSVDDYKMLQTNV